VGCLVRIKYLSDHLVVYHITQITQMSATCVLASIYYVQIVYKVTTMLHLNIAQYIPFWSKANKTVLRECKPLPRCLTLTKAIQIQTSRLIQIRIRMSAGWLPKCCGFIILSTSVISPSVVKIGRDYQKCKSIS